MTQKVGMYLVGYKGFYVLSEILDKLGSSAVSFVVGAGDSGVDRDYFTKIEELTNDNDLPFFRREDLTGKELPKTDIRYAIGWKWLLRSDNDLVIFHDSLLPRYRGFAPLVNSLLMGEEALGVTALRAEDRYDAGPIISQLSLDISYPIKIARAIEYVSPLYAELAVSIYLEFAENGQVKSSAQDEKSATYGLWRDTQDYLIPWSESSLYIRRFCDAVGSPYKGAKTYWGRKAVRVEEVTVLDDVQVVDRAKHVGKVLYKNSHEPVVICGSGLLQINGARFEDTEENFFTELPFRVRFTETQQ